jgi:oxygen-independent coproporphyrinogen-3 oxidase
MEDAVALARREQFETIEVDLVCGLPLQTPRSMAASVRELLTLGVDRVRCLSYRPEALPALAAAIGPGTPFPGARARAQLRRAAVEVLEAAGYRSLGDDLFVLDDDPWIIAAERGELGQTAIGHVTPAVEHLLAFGNGRISDVAGTRFASEPTAAQWQSMVREGRWPIVWAQAHPHEGGSAAAGRGRARPDRVNSRPARV